MSTTPLTRSKSAAPPASETKKAQRRVNIAASAFSPRSPHSPNRRHTTKHQRTQPVAKNKFEAQKRYEANIAPQSTEPEQRSCNGMKLHACSSIQNISYILGLYNSWIRDQKAILKKKPVGMKERIHNSKIANRVNLLNNFHHILDDHATSNRDLEKVQQYIQNTAACGKCVIKKGQISCNIISRHLRDTSKEHKNRNLKVEKFFGYKESEEIATQQLLDTIHSFIYHSFDTLRFSEEEQQEINQLCYNKKGSNDDDAYFLNAEAIDKAQKIIAKKKRTVELICKFDPFQANKKYISEVSNTGGDEHDEDDLDEEEKDALSMQGNHSAHNSSMVWDMSRNSALLSAEELEESAATESSTPTISMSAYSFGKQFVYHKRKDAFMEAFHLLIQPVYKDLKDELLNNKIFHISRSDYNDSYEKGLLLFDTDKARKMKRRQNAPQQEHTRKTSWQLAGDNSFVTVQHLLSIIFYTDYSNLCFAFSQTYRRKSPNEKWSHVVKRHSQFYHWGNLLKETVEEFGRLATKKSQKFYHGLNRTLCFTTFIAQFYGPTSFTDEISVAQSFATAEGMILTLKAHPKYPSVYFDAAWCSLHPNESEKLFIGGSNPLIIHSVLTLSKPRTNHRTCMVAFMLISQMIGIEKNDIKLKFNREKHAKFVQMLVDSERNGEYDTDAVQKKTNNQYMKESFHVFCTSVEAVTIDRSHTLFQAMPELFLDQQQEETVVNMDLFRALFPNATSINITNVENDEEMEVIKQRSVHFWKNSQLEEDFENNTLLILSPTFSSAKSEENQDLNEKDKVLNELLYLVDKYEQKDELFVPMNEEEKQKEIEQLDQWYKNDRIMDECSVEYMTDDEQDEDHIQIRRTDREIRLEELREKYIDCHTGLGRQSRKCKQSMHCGWNRVEEEDFMSLTLAQKLHGYFYHYKEYIEYETNVRSLKYCESHFRKVESTKIRESLLMTMPLLPSTRPSIIGGGSFDTLAQKRQSSILYTKQAVDRPVVEYASTLDEVTPIQHDVLQFGDPWEVKLKDAKFADPKDEILNNSFHTLSKTEWNAILKASLPICQKQEAKFIGLTIKLIVALKLYTDCDKLQDEFVLAYRHEFQRQRERRQQAFYFWNTLLVESCNRSQDVITEKLYRGLNKHIVVSSYSGTWYGPVSMTTARYVANSFIGAEGTVLEMYPIYAKRGLKVDWLSGFSYEKEVIYFNTSFQILNVYYQEHALPSLSPGNSASNHSSLGGWRLSHGLPDNEMKGNDALFDEESNTNFMEKAILRALQLINTESHVISFNDIHSPINDMDDDALNGFNKLNQSEQIAVLYLLYLQYRSDEWDKFWNELDESIKFAFASYRDQFVSLAMNVTAVKMDRLGAVLLDFFCSNQDEYEFPIKGSIEDIENCLLTIEHSSEPHTKRMVQFGTIVRLFPNAQQLSINGDNFDWTLDSFVQFVDQYQLDYQEIALQDIHFKFNLEADDEAQPGSAHNRNASGMTPGSKSTISDDDVEASKLLKKHRPKSKENVHKLMKLGWKFVTASHLHRIGFEPAPELPFFMTFVKDDKMYYRTYSQLLLNTEAFTNFNLKIRANATPQATPGADPDDENDSDESDQLTTPIVGRQWSTGSEVAYTHEPYIPQLAPNISAADSLESVGEDDEFKEVDDHEGFNSFPDTYEEADSGMPDMGDLMKSQSNPNHAPMSRLFGRASVKKPMWSHSLRGIGMMPPRQSLYRHRVTAKMAAQPAFQRASLSNSHNVPRYSQLGESKYSNHPRMSQTEGAMRNSVANAGTGYVVDYNPKHCTLSANIFSTLTYKEELIEQLQWRKKHASVKKLENNLKKSFTKYCNMVEVLVLDPMPAELHSIFMDNHGHDKKKPVPSFSSILSIFPNVQDIFLRETQLTPKICNRLKAYLSEHANCALESVWFCREMPIKSGHIASVKKTLKAVHWDLNIIEQKLFCKDPGSPTSAVFDADQ